MNIRDALDKLLRGYVTVMWMSQNALGSSWAYAKVYFNTEMFGGCRHFQAQWNPFCIFKSGLQREKVILVVIKLNYEPQVVLTLFVHNAQKQKQ